MPKSRLVAESLPPVAIAALRKLGGDLAIARKRRQESQRAWAARIGISLPTLIRLEKGDAGVAVGAYLSALWLIGRADAIGQLANPELDTAAIQRDVRKAVARNRRTIDRKSQ